MTLSDLVRRLEDLMGVSAAKEQLDARETSRHMWWPFRERTLRLLPGAQLQGLRVQLRKVYDCLDLYRRQPGPMAFGLLVAFAFQALRIVQVVVGAWALGIDLPLPYYFAIMPTIILLTLLPISIAAGLPGAWMNARSGLKLA